MAAEEEEKDSTPAKRVLRKLFPAYFALLLLLSGGWLAVTFLGSADTAPEGVRMDLPGTGAPHGDGAHGDAVHDGQDTEHGSTEPAHGDAGAAHDGHDAPGTGLDTAKAAHDAYDDAHGTAKDQHGKPAGANDLPAGDLPPTQIKVLKFGLTERVGLGSLPRIASDGTTPMQAYAARAPESHEPKIAIVVGHLGISDSAVRQAGSQLPREVTFAFSPYAPDVDKMARQAHDEGHEVLLEIPMEPENYPINDAGPYTLRTQDSNLVMLQHLTWVMTRASYYVGLTNDQGQRFLSAAEAVTPVMKFIHNRGLMFFESNMGSGSKGADVAHATGLPYIRAEAVIDSTLTPGAIDAALDHLVKTAKKQGHATGYAHPYPLTIERINRWAETLKRKGVVLVPVTAVVSHHKQ